MSTGHLPFVRVETILSKFHSDLSSGDIDEGDAIDWIGEAMEFLRIPETQVESVCFIEVKDFEAPLPKGFQKVMQIARHNTWTPESKCELPQEVIEEGNEDTSCIEEYLKYPEPVVNFSPYINVPWQLSKWTNHNYYLQHYSHVKLSNNAFFGTLVCEEEHIPYDNCNDEYTIVGEVNRRLRFSFREGYIALAYYKTSVDERGYPMIPDQIQYITAITYYLKWKVAQRYEWLGRQGFARIAQDSERLWLRYMRQGINSVRIERGGASIFKK